MSTPLNNGETLLVGTSGNNLFLDTNGEDSSGQTMIGLGGNDVYQVDSGEDFLIEEVGGGTDTVIVDNDSYWDPNAYWDAQDYWAGGYWDYWDNWVPGNWQGGWDGKTVFNGVNDDYTLAANVDNLTVYGEDSFDFAGNGDANVIDLSNSWGYGGDLYGLGGNDTLIGGEGEDWLEGGAGSDRMVGGWGEDSYYVQDAGDLVIEVTDNTATISINEEQGEDTVYSDITYIAPTGVEHVVLWGKGPFTYGEDGPENGSYSTAAINATGNALDNDLIGNNGNNVLTGLGGSDYLLGEDGNDILAGGVGEDWLYGGAGNDNLDGGDGNDFLRGGGEDGNDVLLGGNGNDWLFGEDGNDRLDGGDGEDFVIDFAYYGEDSGNDTLIGGLGNDFLYSSSGADRLEGGAGNDSLSDSGEDGETNVLLGGDGNDLLEVIDNYGANTLDGGNGNDVLIIGNSGEDNYMPVQMGGGEDNFSGFVLNGGAGDDSYFILGHESAESLTVLDSAGNDTIYLVNGEDAVREILGNDFTGGEDSAGYVSQGEDMDIFTLAAGIENLYADGLNDGEDTGLNAMYLVGNALDNRMVGTDDRDVLIGGAGNDILEGGASADDMVGGAGNDLYIIGDIYNSSANDTVVEAANEGIDTVWAYESYKLENNVEHLRLFGGEDFRGTGNALDNSLTGNDGDNTLSGGIGNDVINGGGGYDRLYGGTGVDRLDGGSGEDFMNGGTGSDTYFVDNLGDVVFEFSDAQTGGDPATDTVFSSVSFELGANIDNLTLTGSAGIDGWGNDDKNVIVGNGGDNWLGDGSTGWSSPELGVAGGEKDTLIGGAGDDTYYVNWDVSGIDTITDSGGTSDWVNLYVGAVFDERDVLALGAGNLAGIEHLFIYGDYDGVGAGPANPDASGFTITGSTVANEIFGSNVGDTIAGGAGNDTLDGQNGADVLKGDAGDDQLWGNSTYSIDDAAADTLEGGDGNDWLYSSDSGADTLIGGNGNDYYFIGDSTGNTFVESSLAAGGSNDVIEAWGQDIDLTGTNIEGAVVLTNTEDVLVTGTSAANFFRVISTGSSGVSLIGGAGNDFYLIEDDYVTISEGGTTLTGGIDTVRSFVDFTLSDNVENLVLAASHDANGDFNYGAVYGMGNAGNNTITGNAGDDQGWNGPVVTSWHGNDLTGLGGNDVLLGDKGDDWLDGDYWGNTTLVGADRMVGGKGNDGYAVNSTADVVVELANEGDDWVNVDNRGGAWTYTLAANVEGGYLLDGWPGYGAATGNAGGIVGNVLDNYLYASHMTGNAMLDGGAGNDDLYGGYGSDSLIGGTGTGNDELYGYSGNDSLNGGAGNDYLDGGYGSDNLNGGDGNDEYVVNSSGDVVTGESTLASGGIDWVHTNGLSSYALGAGVEELSMSNGGMGVTAVGNDLNNIIEIYSNSYTYNTLSGGAGNDTLEGSDGSDWLDGGSGNDRMVGGGGDDTYYVDSTADTAMEEGDEYEGYYGDKVFASGTSFNMATNGWNIEDLFFSGDAGGAAVTQVVGIGNELSNVIDASAVSADKVYLQGGGGDDELYGGDLADILDGGAGEDYLDGGAGVDTMIGGMGDDYYMVTAGDEVFEAPGNGYDTIESSLSFTNKSGVEVLMLAAGTAAIDAFGLDTQGDTLIGNSGVNTLEGGDGDDWLEGGNENDRLVGGNENDFLFGDNGNDLLFGDDGNDVLYGGSGADVLSGGAGNDWLYGGDANNVLTGGAGNDTFVFQETDPVDTLVDFDGLSDLIALDDDYFTALTGYLSGDTLGSGDFADATAWGTGQEIGYNATNGELWYSAVGDGSDMEQIGTLTNFASISISEADFIVI